MAWQATIVRTERPNGSLDIIVGYSNDQNENTFSEPLNVPNSATNDWITQQIQGKVNALNDLDNLETDIPMGIVEEDNIASQLPIEISEPTPYEKWAIDYGNLKQMQLAIVQGFKKVSDQDYIDLNDSVHQNWDPSYLNLLY